jgi:hypothetical protein
MHKRPISVLLIACVYIAVGAIGFVFHFPGLYAGGGFHADDIWIELTELLALICGVFLLRGHNWARWIAVAWIAFHVVISYPDIGKLVIHGVIAALIVCGLFHRAASRYFGHNAGSTSVG